jgi:hypothetical protein
LWHKSKHTEQWNKIEDTEISPLTLDKAAKNILWRKDSLSNKWCWENWKSTCRRLKLDPSHPVQKSIQKWIKGLNVRPETLKPYVRPKILKVLLDNIGKILQAILINNGFLSGTSTAQKIRVTSRKWNCTKIKFFCAAKETITRMMKQPTQWRQSLSAVHPIGN